MKSPCVQARQPRTTVTPFSIITAIPDSPLIMVIPDLLPPHGHPGRSAAKIRDP